MYMCTYIKQVSSLTENQECLDVVGSLEICRKASFYSRSMSRK